MINTNINNKKDYLNNWILDIDKSWLNNFIQMKKLIIIKYITLVTLITSCVTSKTALKNYNSAEYYQDSDKFKKVLKDDAANNKFLLE